MNQPAAPAVPRRIVGTLGMRFLDRIKQDILEHRHEAEYEVVYLTPVPDSRHDFRVRCDRLSEINIDDSESWSQDLLTAYANIKKPNEQKPATIFALSEICKPACTNPKHTKLADSPGS